MIRKKERLEGKTALVTAAGQGIGLATVKAFAAEGATVFAADINNASLAQLRNMKGITPVELDVRDSSMIEKLLTKTGVLDILFNCAGFVHSGTILDCEEADWDYSFNLNVKSMYRIIRASLPAMLENGGASIINMSSILSSEKGAPNRFLYGASKAAVVGLTKALAADFVTRRIRCNAICPGTVETPSLHMRMRNTGNFEQAMKDFIARQPMGRLGKVDEIAALAVYLASDESAFTTGQTFVIDGGWGI